MADRGVPSGRHFHVGTLLRRDAHEVHGRATRVGLRGWADSWVSLRRLGSDVSRGPTGRAAFQPRVPRGTRWRRASIRSLHRRRLAGQTSA